MKTKDKVKILNKQLKRITNSHRALAARSEALFVVSKMVFTNMGLLHGQTNALSVLVYDAQNESANYHYRCQ